MRTGYGILVRDLGKEFCDIWCNLWSGCVMSHTEQETALIQFDPLIVGISYSSSIYDDTIFFDTEEDKLLFTLRHG